MRPFFAAVAAVLLLAGIVMAVRSDERDGDGTRRSDIVRRARALVDVTPAQVGYRLVVTGPRPGLRAQTDRSTRTITLFVAPHAVAHRLAHDLAHELGHAYDDRYLTPQQRRAYLRRRGVPDARWFPGGRFSDYASGAGDFAEVFALCHAASPEFRSRLAARPAEPCALLPRRARELGRGPADRASRSARADEVDAGRYGNVIGSMSHRLWDLRTPASRP
jgi:hypothetical protein